MIKITIIGLSIALLMPISLSSSAQAKGSGLCPGLSGRARTDCLNAEQRRVAEELRKIESKNQKLDKALKAGCAADKVAGSVADAVTKGGGGDIAYAAGKAVGNKMMKGQNPCK